MQSPAFGEDACGVVIGAVVCSEIADRGYGIVDTHLVLAAFELEAAEVGLLDQSGLLVTAVDRVRPSTTST